MIDRRQSVAEGAKTEEEGREEEVGWRGRRATVVWLCRIGMKWQNRKKEIHSPSTIPSNYVEGLYHETISRHEQKFSSLAPPARCPTALFSPPAIVFVRYGARISVEIYPRSRVLMYSGISTGTSCWELSRDGRTRDDGFSEIKWRIAASLFNFVILPPALARETLNE